MRVVCTAWPGSNPSCRLAAQEEYQTGDPGGKKAATGTVRRGRETIRGRERERGNGHRRLSIAKNNRG